MTAHEGELRREDDRWGVRFERRYDATPEELWAALTEPDQLRSWLAPAPVFESREGGRVVIDFGDDGRVDGTILAYDPPALLEYEWRYSGEVLSFVRFELRAEGDATVLVLDHRRLPDDQGPGYGAGWHAHLDCLEAALAGAEVSWDERFGALIGAYRDRAAARGS